ncbi:hypothetical protein F2Q68_00013768 [Brassica cretica]|uniref:SWI/SNF-like complex subunit BAF250 C-terminal domain-containing protein n=1 Tax=Brassica cretica TaxID=69181 RepID=A0A8S9HN84_BRACR|nr:hypothetical protein F2Q68_00013768 [Brassica cretica]
MQKQEFAKSGGQSGGSSAPPAKRDRPFGSTSANSAAAAAAAAAAETMSLSALLEQNNKRIVLALQSSLKSEVAWALNTLTLLSFKERDDIRRDFTPLAKIPGLLDALLLILHDSALSMMLLPLFKHLDDEGRAEKQLCAVAASNVIRNFSFMPDNEVVMAQHRHCLETVYQCINDHMTGMDNYLAKQGSEVVELVGRQLFVVDYV